MKKLYYIMPFILVPGAMHLCEYLDNTHVVKMSPYIAGAVLLLLSAIMGNLTPTKNRFDKLMSILMPSSLCATFFVAGFFDKNDLEIGFDIFRSIEVAAQPIALLLYVIMAATTCLASFRSCRIFNRKQ